MIPYLYGALQVTEESQSEQEVFPLSVIYLDLVVKVLDIRKHQLQLVATACILIASKFRDSNPIDSNRLVAYTDHSITVDDLLVSRCQAFTNYVSIYSYFELGCYK